MHVTFRRRGGTFIPAGEESLRARERERARRKQQRRVTSLRNADEAAHRDMVNSERVAAVVDLIWRRGQGQTPDVARAARSTDLTADEAQRVKRVVARLHELGPRWHQLTVGGELTFVWQGAAVFGDTFTLCPPLHAR